MGLGSVELVIRTEDEFSITISDDEAAAAITVGDLYRTVLAKLDVAPGSRQQSILHNTSRTGWAWNPTAPSGLPPGGRPLLPDETRESNGNFRHVLSVNGPGLRSMAT